MPQMQVETTNASNSSKDAIEFRNVSPIFQEALQNLVDVHFSELAALSSQDGFKNQTALCEPSCSSQGPYEKHEAEHIAGNDPNGICLMALYPERPVAQDDGWECMRNLVSTDPTHPNDAQLGQHGKHPQFVSAPSFDVMSECSHEEAPAASTDRPQLNRISEDRAGSFKIMQVGTTVTTASVAKATIKAHVWESSYGECVRGRRRISRMERFVTHPCFEAVFAFLIFFNSLILAAQIEHDGIDTGHKLGVGGYPRKASDAFPMAADIMMKTNVAIAILFTVEVFLKMLGLEGRFFLYAWNWFDLLVIGSWWVTELLPMEALYNPTMLRLLRLLRLARVVQLLKTAQALEPLQVLVTSIRKSLSILVWAAAILTAIICVASMFVAEIVAPFLNDSSELEAKRQRVFVYFGTFSRAIYSMTEATLGNFASPMRVMTENISPSWGLFFVLYKVSAGFAMLAVITGVFLHETFRVANSDQNIMVIKQQRQRQQHLDSMTRLFRAADTTGIGAITFNSFHEMVTDPYIKSWLAAYEMDVTDVKQVFDLLDDGDGLLTPEELVAGVARLKGPARSIDMHMMLYKMMAQIDEVEERLQEVGRGT